MSELFVGLMTGTSADALDAALVEIASDDRCTLRATLALPLPVRLRRRLLTLGQGQHDGLDQIARLDVELAQFSARAVQELLNLAEVMPEDVVALGSHGQTVRHCPQSDPPYTMQLCDPNVLAELSGICVVADFRRRDIAAGGQGAPLAPAFHRAFFAHLDYPLVVLNLGGIANLSVLHPDRSVTGFDCGPGNGLLDWWAQKNLGVPMDRNGAWASEGQVDEALLTWMLEDAYFKQVPPKSTGREYFGGEWLQGRLQRFGPLMAEDIQATLVELTAQSVLLGLQQGGALEVREVLLCGGGLHNRLLVERLQARLPMPVRSTAVHGVNPDFLEAMGFAWLAHRCLNRLPGNVPAVTGAAGERVLGGVYPA